MSHREVQNAIALLLHDPTFLERLRDDPRTAEELSLCEEERAQLLAIDPRALRVDALRGRRLLGTLSAEYRASLSLAVWAAGDAEAATGFIRSPEFRRAVVERRAFAVALGEYLLRLAGELGSRELDAVAGLELAKARARRSRGRPRGLSLAAGVALGRFPAGTLECTHALERARFELGLVPELALAPGGVPRPELPALCDDEEVCYLILLGDDGSVSLVEISEAHLTALERVGSLCEERDRDRADLAAAVEIAGVVPEGRGVAFVDKLVADGLLAGT